MDKPLPKIGGITIERLPKAGSAVARNEQSSSSVPKRTANISPVLSFPQGVSVQPSSNTSANEDFEEDEENYDDDDDMEGEDEFHDGETSGMNDAAGNSPMERHGIPGKSPIMVSSEEDGGAHGNESEDGNQMETSDEMNTSGSDAEIPQPPIKPFLPPGITFERKKTNAPTTMAVKPNIQLPAGVSLGKRKTVETPPFYPQANWGRPANAGPPARPARGSLRHVRPQRNTNPVANFPLSFPGVPMARTPPVRAVRPRASHQPRMMISDFLEQRMQIGTSPVGYDVPRFRGGPRAPGVRAPRMPRAPRPFRPEAVQNLMQNMQKPRSAVVGNVRPPATKKPLPAVQLPPGVSVQPRVVDVFLGGSDSDPEDDLPLVSKKVPQNQLPKIPPGINFERKKVDRIERVKPLMKHDVEKDKASTSFQNIQLPPGVSYDRERNSSKNVPPTIQLPPGISLEKKKPVPPLEAPSEPRDFEEFGDEEPEEPYLSEEEEYYGDAVGTDNAGADGKLPTGISLEKERSNSENLQTSGSSSDLGEPHEDGLNDGEEDEEEISEEAVSATPTERVAVKNVPSGVTLPPGISLGKQSYNQDAPSSNNLEKQSSDETLEDFGNETHEDIDEYPEEEMGEGEEEMNEEVEKSIEEEEDSPADVMDPVGAHEGEHPNAENGQQENVEQGTFEKDNMHQEEEFSEADTSKEEAMPDDDEAPAEESEEQGNHENEEDMDEGDPGMVDTDVNTDQMDETPEEIDFESLISAPVVATNKLLPQDSETDEEQMKIKQEFEEKDVMQNLVEMMTKGEIEGEIEEDKEDDEEEKKAEKRKAEDGEEEDEDGVSKNKKQQLDGESEQDEEDGESGPIDKSKVSSSHLRKNIREVMDETKLDETTLAAQRQEAERLKRLQEQQRILREVKRQIQLSKNAQKTQNQSQVLSLLKGNTETSILKKSSITVGSSATSSLASKTANHVLLKMSNGQQTCLSDKMRELLKTPGRPGQEEKSTRNLLKQGMLSSSVTIAPIKREPIDEDEKKKRKGDVVTLSSDSDDDCIVLSEEEVESEPEEDPTNSGMHTADKYNIPDEQGRVLVNTGHPPEEADVFLAPQIARIIKPHQIGGIRFLYDNIIESTERYESSTGFGCILAHSMGLGKTLQIVSFSDIFFRHTSGKKILCIMPINTIQNWQAEYNMWLPKENPSGADIRCREFDIHIVNESSKNIHARGKVILDWHEHGGVLLMGYELFRQLSLRKPVKSKRKRPDDSEDERNRVLVEQIYCALVKPGPDLVICDEGHRIKNSHATTSQALKQIRTRRRVVLTGYPLQNNLLEYWCMVDFVRPNYLGSKTEFSNMFERPIQNGQCIDSTPQDKRLMRYRAHVLHSLLEGFVQRRSHAVLQEVLPQKEEYVLLLRFTAFQRQLYDTFMNDVVRTVAVPNPLKAFAVCCKIWNHPDVLYNFLKKKGEQRDLELEEPLPPSVMPPRFPVDMAAPMASSYPANAPPPIPQWPKKGPGSRGGRVRQRKGAMGSNVAPPPHIGDKATSSDSLPSINQFPVQNQTPAAFRGSQDGPAYSSTNSSYQQGNFFPQQQQQQQQQQFQHTDNFPFQRGFENTGYDENDQQMFGNNQKMFGTDMNMFGNNQQKLYGANSQKMFPNEQKPFKNNDFGSNYGSDMSSSNYYRGQEQFPHSSSVNSHFGSGSQQQQQYYQHNDMSVSSGFDYSQTTSSDLTHDFSQISAFSESGFESSNYGTTGNEFQQQQNFWGNNWPSSSQGGYSGGSSGDEFISPSKFPGFEGEKKDSFEKGHCAFGATFPGSGPVKAEVKSGGMDEKKHPTPSPTTTPSQTPTPSSTPSSNPSTPALKSETEDKKEDIKPEPTKKEDIPYDWASELFKNYVTGVVENSSKMEIFFLILTQSLLRQDRMLVFSQSLLTLDLIEDYLQRRCVPGREETWAKNRNYFRLDGSTPAMEREKLINEFNINPQVHIFLVSTRAGSLGINLVGANRVVVFDASWNPCHDTQAVCRVYRYGQRKPCYVYRLVMDCCLEKKIYDRQINKQGMADRVVDELNPDAHLSIKEVTNLCWDDQEETSVKDFSDLKDKYHDDIVKMMLTKHSSLLSKAPFQHESLLIDRKEKKLSQAEKRLAKRSYELEKQAVNQPRSLYQLFPNTSGMRNLSKPIASVKPMQSERFGVMPSRSKWIPAEVWQKQGMSAQEMTLPLDVVIPTNSPDKTSIVLKAGQRVMVLKSPKGIYMQLETGKIIAIRTAFKVGQGQDKPDDKKMNPITTALKNNPNVTITAKSSLLARAGKAAPFFKPSSLDKRAAAVNMAASKGRIAVNNKNRPIPPIMRKPGVSLVPKGKPTLSKKPEDLTSEGTDSSVKKEGMDTVKEGVETAVATEQPGASELKTTEGDEGTRVKAEGMELNSLPTTIESVLGNPTPASSSTSAPHMDDLPPFQSRDDFGGTVHTPGSSAQAANAMGPASNSNGRVPDNGSSAGLMETPSATSISSSVVGATPTWGNATTAINQDMARDIAKESLDSLNSLALSKDRAANQPAGAASYPSETKEATEVKKDPDAPSPWPKQGYPLDPYGNYYPGYPGYYGPPMPGYDPSYPYPRGYPPHVPIKTETQGGTPPPGPAPAPASAAPPLYPPYPNPYPYPYNYPPFPPQAQPPVPGPAPAVVPPKLTESPDSGSFVPPYTPRPPYPAPTPAPGFYPNYPPYRPYHDPNYPYPNYSPYMPHPAGYGYPMQNHHHMQPHGSSDANTPAPPHSTDPPH